MNIGLSLRSSLLWPAFFVTMIALSLMYFVTLKMTKSHNGALLVPILFVFNGTFWSIKYFTRDLIDSGKSLGGFLQAMPLNYAHLAEVANIRFSNVMSDYILPQRSFVFGLAIGLVAVYFLWRYWQDKKEKDLLYTSLTLSAMPLVHTHSFLALGMVSFFLFCGEIIVFVKEKNRQGIITVLKRWSIYFGLPIILLALPQFLLIFPFDKESFIRFQIGWAHGDENILYFWIKNLFPYLFVFAFAYRFAPLKIRTFYNAFLGVFIVTNIILFQPHIYDNMKFMLWWFILSLILTVIFFKKLIEKWSWKGRVVVAIMIFTMTFIGAVSVYRETRLSDRLFSNDDLIISDFVRNNTDPASVFLTSTKHNNPITCLSGRAVMIGYMGWLWTHGINYGDRFDEMKKIFSGKDDGTLVTKYKIDYILLDNKAVEEYDADQEYLDKTYKKIYSDDSYMLYKINND
jgi:hypothetical protein